MNHLDSNIDYAIMCVGGNETERKRNVKRNETQTETEHKDMAVFV